MNKLLFAFKKVRRQLGLHYTWLRLEDGSSLCVWCHPEISLDWYTVPHIIKHRPERCPGNPMQGSIHWGGKGELLLQTLQLPPQNLHVTLL